MRAMAGVSLFAALGLSACGNADERAVCDAYAEYLAAADDLGGPDDVTEATVAEVEDALQSLEDEVSQLRAVADTENESVVNAVDEAIRNLVSSLSSLEQDVPFTSVVDLLSDDIQAVADADADLRETFDTICIPPS
jgi:molybdopterin converting factor small subunit